MNTEELPRFLGPANPWSIAVHMEPFPTSVFSVLSWIFATTTKICTRGCSIMGHPKTSALPRHPPTCSHVIMWTEYHQWTHFSVIHFRGCSIRSVSCYTLLSRFQLPWPLSDCQNGTTPFVVSDECVFGHFRYSLGSALITRSAYQIRSTKESRLNRLVN